ncbi:BBP7 family outer membrane beta-barrel protein [Pirellulimonas nuda]|nr:BBP7 family outer membrane beta-barrel protein [Pirellulimonas nuda]
MNRFQTAILLAAMAAWPACRAWADDLPTPAASEFDYDAPGGPSEHFEEITPPVSSMGDIGGALQPIPQGEQLWEYEPAVTESTGTWLRRGYWYVESDAVVLNRYWDRNAFVLASDLSSGGLQDLQLDRSKPGAEGNVRLTLGRFLFRDTTNRDHTMEFTGFGGGEWTQSNRITSDVPNALFVRDDIDLNNPSFDGASTMQTKYDSRLTMFELNYRVHDRMGRDQMVLTPNGDWVRRANSGLTRNFLVGLRYIDLTENLAWSAQDIATQTTSADSGLYNIRTSNDVIGPQVGGGITYESDRFSVELFGKGGVMLNDAKGVSRMTYANAQGLDDFYTNNREGVLTYVFQTGFIGRWHMRPNLSLRGGYEMLFLVNMAAAPDQIKFDPDFSRVATSNNPFYQGLTLGMEYFW